MTKQQTYIEKEGIGYKTNIDDIIKLLLKDYMGEILYYPAGDSIIEEININGVIISLANGREISLGTYPLYEDYNNINISTYKLPNYITNIISNFPNDNKNIGDIIQWQIPTHSHTFTNPFNVNVKYTKQENNKKIMGATTSNIIKISSVSQNIPIWNMSSTTSETTEQEFKPEIMPLSPYTIVDYRE